jgi:hypothetical protein
MRAGVVLVAVIWSLLTGAGGRAASETPGSVLADHLLVTGSDAGAAGAGAETAVVGMKGAA